MSWASSPEKVKAWLENDPKGIVPNLPAGIWGVLTDYAEGVTAGMLRSATRKQKAGEEDLRLIEAYERGVAAERKRCEELLSQAYKEMNR